MLSCVKGVTNILYLGERGNPSQFVKLIYSVNLHKDKEWSTILEHIVSSIYLFFYDNLYDFLLSSFGPTPLRDRSFGRDRIEWSAFLILLSNVPLSTSPETLPLESIVRDLEKRVRGSESLWFFQITSIPFGLWVSFTSQLSCYQVNGLSPYAYCYHCDL